MIDKLVRRNTWVSLDNAGGVSHLYCGSDPSEKASTSVTKKVFKAKNIAFIQISKLLLTILTILLIFELFNKQLVFSQSFEINSISKLKHFY